VFGVGVEEPDVGSEPDLSLDDDEGFVFDAGEPEVEPESTDEVVAERPPRADRPGRRPSDGSPAEDDPRVADEAPVRTRSTTRFALRALLTVIVGYAILSVYAYTHPDTARELLASLPVLGPRMVETRLNPASIQLTNVHGQYQRVKGDQLVFVIVGTAIDNSPVPARAIQVEGASSARGSSARSSSAGRPRATFRSSRCARSRFSRPSNRPRTGRFGPGSRRTS